MDMQTEFVNAFEVLAKLSPQVANELLWSVKLSLLSASRDSIVNEAGHQYDIDQKILHQIVTVMTDLSRHVLENKMDEAAISSYVRKRHPLAKEDIVQLVSSIFAFKTDTVTPHRVSMPQLGQLVDIQWKIGMAVSSSLARSLNIPLVTVQLKLQQGAGDIVTKCFEMSLAEFRSFAQEVSSLANAMEIS